MVSTINGLEGCCEAKGCDMSSGTREGLSFLLRKPCVWDFLFH